MFTSYFHIETKVVAFVWIKSSGKRDTMKRREHTSRSEKEIIHLEPSLILEFYECKHDEAAKLADCMN